MLVTGIRRCSVQSSRKIPAFQSCFFDFPIDGNLLQQTFFRFTRGRGQAARFAFAAYILLSLFF